MEHEAHAPPPHTTSSRHEGHARATEHRTRSTWNARHRHHRDTGSDAPREHVRAPGLRPLFHVERAPPAQPRHGQQSAARTCASTKATNSVPRGTRTTGFNTPPTTARHGTCVSTGSTRPAPCGTQRRLLHHGTDLTAPRGHARPPGPRVLFHVERAPTASPRHGPRRHRDMREHQGHRPCSTWNALPPAPPSPRHGPQRDTRPGSTTRCHAPCSTWNAAPPAPPRHRLQRAMETCVRTGSPRPVPRGTRVLVPQHAEAPRSARASAARRDSWMRGALPVPRGTRRAKAPNHPSRAHVHAAHRLHATRGTPCSRPARITTGSPPAWSAAVPRVPRGTRALTRARPIVAIPTVVVRPGSGQHFAAFHVERVVAQSASPPARHRPKPQRETEGPTRGASTLPTASARHRRCLMRGR